MKNLRFLTVLVLGLGCWLMASAGPARRGQWKTLRLTDGTEVRAQLMGDETLHYWQDANGFTYICSDEEDIYVRATRAMESKLQAKRNARVARRMPSRRAMASPHKYTGKKKGLVILAQYPNKKFSVGTFAWGACPTEAVHNAAVMEEVAFMDWHAMLLNPYHRDMQKALLDRHYLRKHGPAAYYGQDGAK